LGVIWDGTGFGNDGQIWGGEFFIYSHHNLIRANHFDYFDFFLGDKMAAEPRLSAFSLCHDFEEAATIIQPKFTATEWNNYQKIIATNRLKTSSMGRLFDAVASLLGLIDKATYEGEGAMLLEEEAYKYFQNELKTPAAWLKSDFAQNPLSKQSLVKQILRMINEGVPKPEIAAWFHTQLILIIQAVALMHGCTKLCCSGGVFQNGLLVDLSIKILGEKCQLYFNKEVSPNDENISFGQLIWFTIMKKEPSIK
ncbi:MAG: carbamoyltransferase HypF, partial [Bacteroidota bacterium]|nr:carbamoyltransferase HypF [Bacteroidota bacterium]